MVDENRSVATHIDGEIRQAHEEMAALRDELADTNRRFEEHLSISNNNNNNSNGAAVSNSSKMSSSELSEVTSVIHTPTLTPSTEASATKGINLNDNCGTPLKISSPLKIKLDNLSPTRLLETEFPQIQTNGSESICGAQLVDLHRCKDLSIELEESLDLVNGEDKVDVKQLIRPPSPIPGPSNKPDYGMIYEFCQPISIICYLNLIIDTYLIKCLISLSFRRKGHD